MYKGKRYYRTALIFAAVYLLLAIGWLGITFNNEGIHSEGILFKATGWILLTMSLLCFAEGFIGVRRKPSLDWNIPISNLAHESEGRGRNITWSLTLFTHLSAVISTLEGSSVDNQHILGSLTLIAIATYFISRSISIRRDDAELERRLIESLREG